MELTQQQIDEQGAAIIATMVERGYVNTASGDNKATLFFLKKIDAKLSIHAMVYLKRSYVVLDILGMLDMGISLRGLELALDNEGMFTRTEAHLLDYLAKCLNTDSSPARETEVNKLKEEEKKPKPTIAEREKEFWERIRQAGKDKYSKEMCLKFYRYWTETNEGGKKMRFEMQKVFDLPKRLVTWNEGDKKHFANKQSYQEQRAEKELNELKEAGTKITKTSDLF